MSVDASQLREMMNLDSEAVSRLKLLLAEERQLLETRKHEELQAVIEEKSELVERLSKHAQMRHKLLQLLKLPQTPQGWDMFLQRNVQTLPMREGWKSIIAEFSECQKLNDINGKMISRSRQTLAHLLGLLRGQVANPSLYNAYGATTQQNTSYTVAKA